MRLLICGASGGTNVGDSFLHAAQSTGIPAQLLDMQTAWQAPWWRKKLFWHLRGGRPPGLETYGAELLRVAASFKPSHFLSTGFAPVGKQELRALRRLGIKTLNFLTDDPWSKVMRGSWSIENLVEYDFVFTPRHANFEDLRSAGVRSVHYLPFGFDPRHFFPSEMDPELQTDVIFVGGGDSDRIPWIRALLAGRFNVALYGRYWERFPESRAYALGMASPQRIRAATASAKVALCLVRRANRDGHVMRSLEIPRTQTCMLTEDTHEHRELFGPEGECVRYFSTPAEMVDKARQLLADASDRHRLATAAFRRISEEKHSYAARLTSMLDIASDR